MTIVQKDLNLIILKKSSLLTFLSIFLYKIFLDVSYYFVISPLWEYAGLNLNLNYLKLVESYLLLFVILILMPKSKVKLSNIMLWLLILLSYIPMLTLFALKDESRIFMYAATGFWLFVFLLLEFFSLVSIPPLKEIQSTIIRYLIFFSLFLVVLLMIYKYYGISFNFNLAIVYEIRKVYKEAGIPLAGYLFNWMAYVVNPFFFVLFLTKRKWLPVILITVLQLLLFSATGHKSYFFILPFILCLMWIVTKKNPLFYFSSGLTAIIILSMLSYWLINDIWVSSLFTRRVLFVPAQLSFLYYDFFSNNSYTFLSQHRIFRIFLDYPYHLAPPHLIGEVYFNAPDMSANNGIYADAYMNFGFVGFVLWGFLLAIILKLIDSFSKNKKITVTIAIISMPSLTLVNSALLTSLLTHGLLLALFLLYLLSKKEI